VLLYVVVTVSFLTQVQLDDKVQHDIYRQPSECLLVIGVELFRCLHSKGHPDRLFFK